MSLVASEIVVMVITASGAAINDKVYFSAFYTSLVFMVRILFRNYSVCGLSQWKTTLQCNVVTFWLSQWPDWSLPIVHVAYVHCVVIKRNRNLPQMNICQEIYSYKLPAYTIIKRCLLPSEPIMPYCLVITGISWVNTGPHWGLDKMVDFADDILHFRIRIFCV